MTMKWFVVHTYSGQENRAKLNLVEKIRQSGMTDQFGEVLIPTENVLEVVKGQRRQAMRKFYPGYLFVQMELNEKTFHLVKNTPKITGFLGGTNPTPVRETEIAAINSAMAEGQVKPKPRIHFEEGDSVRVTEGPFANFSGTVEDVKPEKQKVRVLVSIFGRATPVELDFTQVEKA
jgi:transcription termination/antitermination protein NusG